MQEEKKAKVKNADWDSLGDGIAADVDDQLKSVQVLL